MRQNLQLIVLLALVTGLAMTARGQMDLYERLGALDERLLLVDARLMQTQRTAPEYAVTVPTAVRAPTARPATQEPARVEPAAAAPPAAASNEPVPAPAIALEATERGYMYGQEWADMEHRLAAMSKEENKAFWDEMFRAIEAGELEVYDE